MYCGIDVSKNRSSVCILDKKGNVTNEFEIKHTKEGIDKLKTSLEKGTKIALEVTGNYSKVIYNNLFREYDTCYVDGVQMSNIAKYYCPTMKNDKIDARLLAKALMFPGLLKVNPLGVDELRDLSRLYQKLRTLLVIHKSRFKDQLNIIFPELEALMRSSGNIGIANLLLKYPNPKEIIKHSEQEILDAMKTGLKKGAGNFDIKKAIKIKELARKSIGDSMYPTANFRYTIETTLYFLKLRKKIKADLEIALQKTPYYGLINKYGFDTISLSMIVGEVGDIRRFQNYKRFASYCGFGIYERRSGTSMNKSTRLNKRGNKLLRSTFYTLVLLHLSKKTSISKYYEKLKNRGKHPKKCLVAAARKIAIRTYYDMIKCHEEYSEIPKTLFNKSEFGFK
jgi:transposase